MTYTMLMRRPRDITASTFIERLGKDNIHLVVGTDEDGNPIEVLAYYKKNGSDEVAMVEGLTRMISTSLQAGVDPLHIIRQLKGIRGETVTLKEGGDTNLSIPDIMAKVLEKVVRGSVGKPVSPVLDNKPVTNVPMIGLKTVPLCPDCSSEVIFQEGCQKCMVCGWSKC